MVVINLFKTANQEDPIIIECHTINEMVKAIKENDKIGVWLATKDCEHGEILITENIDTICNAIKTGVFNLVWNTPQTFALQYYECYEDAYNVAKDMREANPLCYTGNIGRDLS